MTNFLNNLYNNEHFVLYLSIAIGVLVVLFIIVYFCGRKDQKLEETRKIKLESLKGFKEENKEITDDKKLEVENPLIVEDETEILPVINDEDKQPNEVTTTVFEPINDESSQKNIKEDTKIEEPTIEIIPFQEDKEEYNDPKMAQIDNDLEKELSDLAKIKDEFYKMDVDNNSDVSDQQFFSSVYVNNENNHNKALEENMDLPTLKRNSENSDK